jgi:hypothetical protein
MIGNLRGAILDILGGELLVYANTLRANKDIPREYSDAIFVVELPELDLAAIAIEFLEQKKYEYKRFGNATEYAIYTCPRRKYFGGKILPEYNGPSYIKEKWKTYKPIFVTRVIDSIKAEVRWK